MSNFFLLIRFNLVLSLIFTSPGLSWACRAGVFSSGSHVFVAKSFDFDVSSGRFYFNPRGLQKQALLIPTGPQGLVWTSRYKSLTFSQIGPGFPFGGMNEKGLVVEALWLTSTETLVNEVVPTVNESQYIQYLLDNAQNILEAEKLTKQLQIQKVFAPIHYFICDRSSECLTVEILRSQINITRVVNSYDKVIENLEYSQLIASQDSKILRSFQESLKLTPASVQTSFEWLDKVKTLGWTRWQLVYDVNRLEVHIKKISVDGISPSSQKISLNQFTSSKIMASATNSVDFTPWTLKLSQDDLAEFTKAFPVFRFIAPLIENFLRY